MTRLAYLKGAASLILLTALIGAAGAETFNIPGGDLKAALDAYANQTGVNLIVASPDVQGIRSPGAHGNFSPADALNRILLGTGFSVHRHSSGSVGIARQASSEQSLVSDPSLQLAQATAAPRGAVETVTVTSSKLGGADVQSIPISITALSQEQLTATQTAGGPDLIKQVPNMSFTKTNFSGYSIQLRGIGTQAISVTTDPAVAVAFNDIPFIRNHFFEQEFYDVAQVEVLRGPQGTLYGRNATAGVVNLSPAKPSDQFEAMAAGELGNYHQRRFEGMLNIPIVDDRIDVRIAGEWTKRKGYSFNALTNERTDGRDLWSGRITIGLKPTENLQMYLVWEHFAESDDRIRSSKQLCKTSPIPQSIEGVPLPVPGNQNVAASDAGGYFAQGCLPSSLYSQDAFEVPNGFTLPYIAAGIYGGILHEFVDPYATATQSRNLRVFESALDPTYKVNNDVVELNAEYNLTPQLSISSQTGFNHDFLHSTQDYNRFNTNPGIFNSELDEELIATGQQPTHAISPQGVFCDPQLGCSDRLVAQDLSTEHAWQFSQELRLASNLSGPINFTAGGNYLHYETEENYYVFINALTLFAYQVADLPGLCGQIPWVPGVSDGSGCIRGNHLGQGFAGFQYPDPSLSGGAPGDSSGVYIDPNPISSLNNEGHNYFLSQNPYVLNSYAAFGEVNYQILDDLKLIAGLRWTEDKKHFTDIPSELITNGYGYPSTGTVNQQWDQFTGRAVANWTPKLSFTDQSLIYASYAHGYKAGGANPPGARLDGFQAGDIALPSHPLTFKPEFIDAFEFGGKNTLLDGSLTLNANVFYYNYENYQISEIVDRTSINLNFDAHVKGAELEGTWEPIAGLRFNFAGGWEDTAIAKGQHAIDLIDRTAGNPDWMVIKPFIAQASNCILPISVVKASLENGIYYFGSTSAGAIIQACAAAYSRDIDPVTDFPFVPNPTLRCEIVQESLPSGCDPGAIAGISGYAGFDPTTAPNNGEGFAKDLGGNQLPNAPPLTASVGAQYTVPLSSDWAGTLRGDYYWQDYSWARVFNDNPYDRLRGYTNINLTLILTSQTGWQVMLYDKNILNTTAITGTFLNSDDSGLTTNIFLTDPKLIGLRVTKSW